MQVLTFVFLAMACLIAAAAAFYVGMLGLKQFHFWRQFSSANAQNDPYSHGYNDGHREACDDIANQLHGLRKQFPTNAIWTEMQSAGIIWSDAQAAGSHWAD